MGERTRSYLVLAAIFVMACGGERAREPARGPAAPAHRPSPPALEAVTAAPRSPLAEAFAQLPTAIVAADPTPIGWIDDQLVTARAPVFAAACWRSLAATIDGYYAIDLRGAPERAVFHPHLIHGSIGLDALRRCRVSSPRHRGATHPRVLVVSDAGFFPVTHRAWWRCGPGCHGLSVVRDHGVLLEKGNGEHRAHRGRGPHVCMKC